jgi:membrane-associated phospholipid phosphatase
MHATKPSAPERLDLAVVDALEPWLRKRWVKAVGAIGNIGDQPPLLALSAAIMLAGVVQRDTKLARTGGRMTLAHLLATAAKGVGKDHTDRTRPRQRLESGSYEMHGGHSEDPELRSFPSGHTAGAVALARSVAREYPDAAGTAYAGATAIGALQLPRRAHFPTDIVAGAVVGVVAELLVDRLINLWWKRAPDLA